jgi:hypothetical protein
MMAKRPSWPVKTQNAQIKVEVNTTIRGNLLPPRMMDVAGTVEAEDDLITIVLKRKGFYGGYR